MAAVYNFADDVLKSWAVNNPWSSQSDADAADMFHVNTHLYYRLTSQFTKSVSGMLL